MTRRLFIISLTVALSCLAPVSAGASSAYLSGVMELSQEQDISVSYAEGVLHVIGAEGQTLEIVSLTGKKVLDVKIESPAQKVELNIPKGCYIVKIGNMVRKISVR